MAKSTYSNRQYTLSILGSLVPPILLVFSPVIPDGILFTIAVFVWFASLYVCSILEPVFRSWKALSFWQTIHFGVGQYVESREAIAEGEDMILTGTLDFERAQAKSRRGYSTKFDEVCSRLESVAERYRKEAHEAEYLLEKLHTSREDLSK